LQNEDTGKQACFELAPGYLHFFPSFPSRFPVFRKQKEDTGKMRAAKAKLIFRFQL
jgi:hypothetical protein